MSPGSCQEHRGGQCVYPPGAVTSDEAGGKGGIWGNANSWVMQDIRYPNLFSWVICRGFGNRGEVAWPIYLLLPRPVRYVMTHDYPAYFAPVLDIWGMYWWYCPVPDYQARLWVVYTKPEGPWLPNLVRLYRAVGRGQCDNWTPFGMIALLALWKVIYPGPAMLNESPGLLRWPPSVLEVIVLISNWKKSIRGISLRTKTSR